jgi:hypothetical protein
VETEEVSGGVAVVTIVAPWREFFVFCITMLFRLWAST